MALIHKYAVAFGALSLSALLPHAAAHAQVAGDHAPPASQDDLHADDEGSVIVVTGHLPVDSGLLAGAVSMEGDRLVAESRGQIGEVLASLPGVSASSFAPGVSRPVLRGFDGDRIAVLTDGIGSIDASNVSADHAVVFDTLTVDHIDVVHGPAVLLFGGQAIGGAVNAIDKRIPRRVPDAISGTVIGGYATAADERSLGGAVDVPLADRLALHFDADWRKSDDVRVGGFVNSPQLRAALFDQADALRAEGDASGADELEASAQLSGRVPNSSARSTTLGAGLAFIDTGGNIGVSVQRFTTRYGVPSRPGPGAESGVAIDLAQTRVDLRAAVNIGGFFKDLEMRGAYGDYAHSELEDGSAGTRFDSHGFEFRGELVQADNGGWRGRSGAQVMSRALAVTGEEAILPANNVDRFGLFTLQSVKIGPVEIEGSGRYEQTMVKAPTIGFHRTFDLWSGAVGLSVTPLRDWKAGANFVHGARAPAPEELLTDGIHVATQAYERGDPGFGIEKSNGFEAYLRYTGERANLSLTGYVTRFSNFIAAVPTGEEVEGFPVYAYVQLPARYKGFEAAAGAQVMDWGDGGVRVEGSADYVHARLKGVGPVPRIPPLRLRGGFEVRQGTLRVRGEVEWNDRQNRVAILENPVDSFTEVNLSADWHPLGDDGPLTLLLAANNIFDSAGRRASSFTRDFVPLPGRDIRVTAKVNF